jgi:hypothetical protein
MSMTLFVIGEGRWQVNNAPRAELARDALSWDYRQNRSNFAELRAEALSDGRSWLTSYAMPGALLSERDNPLIARPIRYDTLWGSASTIAEAYVMQGRAVAGELGARDDSCLTAFRSFAESAAKVGPSCEPRAPDCADDLGAAIDARLFACGELDDVAVALAGKSPRDVWITRLQAELGRDALDDDLVLEAAEQAPVDNWLLPTSANDPPCPLVGAAVGATKRPSRPKGGGWDALATSLALALALAFWRRSERSPREAGEAAGAAPAPS